MRTFIIAATLCGLGFACVPGHAQSAYSYPWCSINGDRSGAMTCYFETRAQCEATISGIGGSCIRSPYFHGDRRFRR